MNLSQEEIMYDLMGFLVYTGGLVDWPVQTKKPIRSYMTCFWGGSISTAHINGNHWSQLTGL